MACPFSIPQLEAVLAAHGYGGRPIRPRPDTGYVNWVFEVGDDLILRVCKPHVGCEDGRTEALVVPLVVAAGIRTPELLVFDESQDLLPASWTLYRRAEGDALAETHADQSRLPDLYRDLGREIARIHTRIKPFADPKGWLDKGEFFDPRAELERAREALKVEMVSRDWLLAWIEKLEPAMTLPRDPVFIHNDLHAGNTLIRPDTLQLTAVIDWGDAAWADPVLDFETMPIFALPWALEGYREEGGEVDETFIGRLIYHDIGAALEAGTDEWLPGPLPWAPLTSSRWINLIRLLSTNLPKEWHPWLPD